MFSDHRYHFSTKHEKMMKFKQGSYYVISFLETVHYCSVIVYVHCADCIDTVFQNCGGHLQALNAWCLLNLFYYDMFYTDSTAEIKQSVKASGQPSDIQKVNGKQMAVLFFKFAESVSPYTHRVRKIRVKIYCDTNFSWVCIICSLEVNAEISSTRSMWKVW